MIKPDVSQLSTYTYDPKSLRYKNRLNGKFVSAKEVRDAVDIVIDKEELRIRDVSQQLVDGKINLAEWQIQTSTLLKNLHVAMGLAANGGLNNTSASDMAYIANQVKEQYKYLRDFAKQIKNNTQKLDGSLMARAAQYVQASRATYEHTLQRKAIASGLSLEKSVLDGAAQHCGGCAKESSKGWVKIGTLIPIGQRDCRGNCKCHFVYRVGEAA